jgi:hypothetical protein
MIKGHKIKNKMKKTFSILGIAMAFVMAFLGAPSVFAAANTAIAYTPSGSVISTFIQPSTTLGVFTPTTAILAAGTITFTLPAGTVITEGNVAAGDFTIQQAANGGVAGVATAPTGVVATAAARTLVFTVAANSLSTGAGAGTGVVTVAMSGTATGDEIQNPAVANSGLSFTVATAADTGTIATVVFNPAAITNLFCQTPNQGGAVYLTWTVPAGVTGGYLIHYSSGDITTQNLFNAATNYINTFVNGTPGQSSGSNLLVGLAPNATYFFNVEALGAGTSQAAISNIGVVCRIGSGASSNVAALAAAAPKSSIVSPTADSSVPAEAAVTVRGVSSDTEASSIAKVEISTDGGTTWVDTVPTVSNSNYGFDWEYAWTNPAEGPHLLKTRATDRAGNVETPSAGITVTVGQKAGIIYVPVSEMPVAGTPAAAVNATQIRAQITTIQQQIIVLIQQLIAQLMVELQSAH